MLDRREFMRRTAAAGLSAALWPLTACERSGVGTGEHSGFQPHPPPSGPAREFVRIARPAEVDITPLGMFRRWTYDGSYPGPEIRVREGERLRVRLENRLPDPTTVHWHGVPVPNAMDGVPGVTQDAVEPDGDFIYDFTAAPAGSYLYHSHVGLQLDQGLHGPLVIEETTPHVEYDREATLILDGLLPGPPQPPDLEGGMGRGMMRRRGRGMMEMMDDGTPEYHAFLLNGRAPEDPETIEVGRGKRIRLRIMNPSSSTTFRVAVAGHRMQVTHSDGRPVEPVEVDALEIGMGERYDVVVEAENPGVWSIAASGVGGGPPPARALLRYADASPGARSDPEIPAGLREGRLLGLSDLRSIERDAASERRPDRTIDLSLRREGMMRGAWTIDGQRWPDADPLRVSPGERVRVRMVNRSPHRHPMHLHGFFFRVGDALKETVVVPGHMGRISFEYTADKPGDWFFHCHHLYHMESGMARVFGYR